MCLQTTMPMSDLVRQDALVSVSGPFEGLISVPLSIPDRTAAFSPVRTATSTAGGLAEAPWMSWFVEISRMPFWTLADGVTLL
jgi:hypothetical protein